MPKPEIGMNYPVSAELKAGDYYWCACGKSSKQPYCDGSHKGSDFTPLKLEIEEKTKVWLCGCKQTSKPPFCDGTHKQL